MSNDERAPKTAKPEPAALLREYLSAFAQANPGKAAPGLRYERGWFVDRMYGGYVTARYRAKELAGMRDRLLARVKENSYD